MEFFVGSEAFKTKFESGAGLASRPQMSFGDRFVVGSSEPFKTCHSTNFVFGGARLTENSFLSHWNFDRASEEEVYAHYKSRDTEFSLGIFSLLAWSDDEWELSLDKLAQYTIYIWTSGEDYLISNSLELMVKVLRLGGINVERSTQNTIEALVYGTTFGGATGFEGITLYRSPKASFSGNQLHIEEYEFVKDLYSTANEGSYDDLLKKTLDFVRTAAKNISSDAFGGKILSDLTGGVDSRFVLSILLSSSLRPDEINVFCLGSDARADKIVADYLVEKYKLSPGEFFNAKSPEGSSPADSIEKGVYRFYGMKLADYGDFGDGKIVGQTKMTGYYGELSRLFYDYKSTDNERLVEKFVSVGGLDRYISEDVVSSLRGKMLDFFQTLDDLGLAFDDKLHALYLLNRNKIHCGMSAHLAEKTRQAFHPLNCSLFVKLSLLISRPERKANKVAFDMIGHLTPSLLMEPMAEKVWSPKLFPSDFDYESYRERCFIEGGSEAISSVSHKYKQKNLLHRAVTRVYENKAFSDRMRKLGVQYHWALLPDLKVRIEEYLDHIDSGSGSSLDSVSDVLNIENIRELVSSLNFDPESQGKVDSSNVGTKLLPRMLSAVARVAGREASDVEMKSHKEVGPSNIEAKFLLRVLSALSWLSGREEFLPIDYVFDVRNR